MVFLIDKFMSKVRALTDVTGNGTAAVFVSWRDGELDYDMMHANFNKSVGCETAVTIG